MFSLPIYICLQSALFTAAIAAQLTGRYALTDLFVFLVVSINAASALVLAFRPCAKRCCADTSHLHMQGDACRDLPAQTKKSTASKLPAFALILTFCADILLVLFDAFYGWGTFLFCCVQTLYAIYLFHLSVSSNVSRPSDVPGALLSSPAYTILMRILLLAAAATMIVRANGLTLLNILAAFSISQLLVNTLSAFRIFHISKSRADRLLALGLLLFLGCDVCVGIRNSRLPGNIQDIAFALNWIFYIPSQILLFLSYYTGTVG